MTCCPKPSPSPLPSARWSTRWEGDRIVITREGKDLDEIAAPELQRVVMVCPLGGISPGDLQFVLFELPDSHVLLAADSGIGARIQFERAAFWAERACVYWLARTDAPLPTRLDPGLWRWHARPEWLRLPRRTLEATVASWPVGEPKSWEARQRELIHQV